MINFKITIGQKIFAIKATKDTSVSSIKTERIPVGVQSGLFPDDSISADKYLYEKRQRKENRPRMVVEQVHDIQNNAILLPGMDSKQVFRPLWVTVPVENDREVFIGEQPKQIVKNLTNIRKLFSIIQTSFIYLDERVTKNIQTLSQTLSQYFQVKTIVRYKRASSFGLQPALFDATPIASMEKARYIASRESFSGGGLLPGVAWRFPTVKFVLSIPKNEPSRGEQKISANISHKKYVSIPQKVHGATTLTLNQLSMYVFGLAAVVSGVIINIFFLH